MKFKEEARLSHLAHWLETDFGGSCSFVISTLSLFWPLYSFSLKKKALLPSSLEKLRKREIRRHVVSCCFHLRGTKICCPLERIKERSRLSAVQGPFYQQRSSEGSTLKLSSFDQKGIKWAQKESRPHSQQTLFSNHHAMAGMQVFSKLKWVF